MSCDSGTATADWMVRRAAAERAVPFRALLERVFAARIVSLSEAARITTWRQNEDGSMLRAFDVASLAAPRRRTTRCTTTRSTATLTLTILGAGKIIRTLDYYVARLNISLFRIIRRVCER